MTLRAVALLALVVIAVGGCAPIGRNFVRPEQALVAASTTTLAQVKERYGPPRTERSWSRGDAELAREAGAPFGVARVSGTMHELYYYYEERFAEGVAPGVQPSRSARFWFFNGRLVGYISHSSFQADSTVFDESRVASIKAWKSFRADVVAALGEPSGMRVYPMVRAEDLQVMTYYAFEFDRGSGQTRTKMLHILTDSIGVVRDIRYDSSAKPIPPVSVPSTVPVQVYTPPPKKK